MSGKRAKRMRAAIATEVGFKPDELLAREFRTSAGLRAVQVINEPNSRRALLQKTKQVFKDPAKAVGYGKAKPDARIAKKATVV